MTKIPIAEAGPKLEKLVEETASDSTPILITGSHANAVLLSEDHWRSIQETLYLVSIPGMRDSILEGRSTPIEECIEAKTLDDLERQLQTMSEDPDQ